MTRSQVQAKKLDDTLGNLKAEAMLALPTDTLAEVENETLGDRLGDPEAEELLVEFAATLADMEDKTCCNTIGDAEVKTLLYTPAPHTTKDGAWGTDLYANWYCSKSNGRYSMQKISQCGVWDIVRNAALSFT